MAPVRRAPRMAVVLLGSQAIAIVSVDVEEVAAHQVADDAGRLGALVRIVLDDHDLPAGTRVAALVSGLGATPRNELYVLYDRIAAQIEARGLVLAKSYVGDYFTSLEMVGATPTVMALDAELEALLEVETACPGF